ncbi:MAG TPA: choice-of-anchor tandem repeat NxxGxxAF-containing protein, partial [Candidatus Limnocylindria bacterium]|nr:choice-of-anchor tandem repeat NxxGxxAF-containing protein [Candidatus Limnocylindria bacterium]
MSLRRSPRHTFVIATILLAACQAEAASVRLIAGLTDPAPGGGIFAGTGFVGNPAAAGNGYVAFRSLIADGSSPEAIVLATMEAGTKTSEVVAFVGQAAGEGLGTFASFVGNPSVNAEGDVAFVATLRNATELPEVPNQPAPAALFVYDKSTKTLTARVRARASSPAGPIAFVESFDGSADVNLDGRSPALNDAGDLAFTAATRVNATTPGGAVFRLPAVGSLQVVAETGNSVGGSTFIGFGPPAINAGGAVAFRGRLTGGGPIDGVFRWKNGALTTIARNGDEVTTAEPEPHDQILLQFGDAVAIRNDDAVVFVAAPLFDFTFVEPNAPPLDPEDGSFGLLFGTGAGPLGTLLYPGQTFETRGRVSDVRLQSEFATEPPGASFASDGDVLGYAALNGGSSEVLARIEGPGQPPTSVIVFGGASPTPSPIGGTYLTAAGTPTIDDADGIALFARLAGGPASDALIYMPAAGAVTFIVAGEATPNPLGGMYAGPPFSNPAANDQGDVVFRAFVAQGPAGLGLYRWRNGATAPLVRVGDPAPVPGNLPFTNIVGEHDLNDAGTVAFSAVVGGLGRGVYTAGPNGMARVAVVGDAGPAGLGTNVTFVAIVGNPAISNDGAVAFRGRVQFTDSGGATRRRDGIFVRSGSQVRALAITTDPSPEVLPFFRFRDLSLRQGVRVAFTATLGEDEAEQEGLFVADLTSMGTVAIVGQALEGSLRALSGRPSIDRDGAVTMLGRIGTPGNERAALLRGNTAFFEPVVRVGDELPSGGVVRSLGRPAVSPAGRAAVRTTFEPNSGGVGGFYLTSAAGVVPFVSIGDAAPLEYPNGDPLGGRFSSFNQRAALSTNNTLAFIASLAGSAIENGLFVASPSSFSVKRARVKLGTSTKADTLTLQAELDPGGLASSFDPTQARLALTVRDSGSAVWSQNLASGDLVKKGKKYVFRAPPDVRLIAVSVNRKTGRIKLKVRAQPDFSGG